MILYIKYLVSSGSGQETFFIKNLRVLGYKPFIRITDI